MSRWSSHGPKRRRERLSAGLCADCGLVPRLPGLTRCELHYGMQMAARPVAGERRCGVCREYGHNKQTHGRVAVVRTKGTETA